MTAEKSLEKIAEYMRDISRSLKRIEGLLETKLPAKERKEFDELLARRGEDDLK